MAWPYIHARSIVTLTNKHPTGFMLRPVMFSLFRSRIDNNEEEDGVKVCSRSRVAAISQSRMEASELWRNWWTATFCPEKKLGGQKRLKKPWRHHWSEGRQEELWKFDALRGERGGQLFIGGARTFWRRRRRNGNFCILRNCWLLVDPDGELNRWEYNGPPAGEKLDRAGGGWWTRSRLASSHGHRSTFERVEKMKEKKTFEILKKYRCPNLAKACQKMMRVSSSVAASF